jgi:methylphosphotriester-DNA--protein-cysteine methyltransferase
MITHLSLGKNFSAKRKLYQLISSGEINLAGNRKLRIYGTLACFSGRRMKPENRVFFSSEEEAIAMGYRCCKNCWCRKKKKDAGNKREL